MAASDQDDTPPQSSEDRLGSWKAIAAYLKRDITTVQRWERREGMPVHRHVHDKRGSVYAFRAELDSWLKNRRPRLDPEPEPEARAPASRRPWGVISALVGALALAALAVLWLMRTEPNAMVNPFAEARISPLTDFDGLELAATISRDGRFVGFLSDRDGVMDAWVTQVGTGEFHNLTKGRAPELLNPEVRSLAFTPDGALLTMWTRSKDADPAVNVLAVPTMGGALREYRAGAVELDWSDDGKRMVFHTPDVGDPTFIVEPGESTPRPIFTAPKGEHVHFQAWSPKDAYIYFVRGVPPDEMDLWRMTPEGKQVERITFHNARVSYPTFLDDRSLLYLATSYDGSGPWLYMLDVDSRQSRRLSFGVEQYTSIAASADRSRFVATVEHSKATLWRVPISDAMALEADASRVAVPTIGAFSPRAAASSLLFVSAKNDGHAILRLENGEARELWSAPQTRVVGGPAISPDGKSIAFSAERAGGTKLYLLDLQRSSARVLGESLEVRGAPAWAPDGRSIIVAISKGAEPQLYRVPLDAQQSPSVLVSSYSVNPLWSPDQKFIVYVEADSGPDFTLKAVSANGEPYALPDIRLARGARRVTFVPGRNAMVVLQGQMRHNNFWYIDLDTGERRQLTNFGRDFTMRDFDVTPDAREIVFDRREDNPDLALIELENTGEK
jgi:Tol biopolymer transport system component